MKKCAHTWAQKSFCIMKCFMCFKTYSTWWSEIALVEKIVSCSKFSTTFQWVFKILVMIKTCWEVLAIWQRWVSRQQTCVWSSDLRCFFVLMLSWAIVCKVEYMIRSTDSDCLPFLVEVMMSKLCWGCIPMEERMLCMYDIQGSIPCNSTCKFWGKL